VILVDEVAFLTAYQPDRKLREKIMNALATLTTQGRAVGYCMVAALQNPRKEVLSIRTCSRTRSPCGSMNPNRLTWCWVTAPGTAARPANDLHRSYDRGRGGVCPAGTIIIVGHGTRG
jgi:hypothetical protein